MAINLKQISLTDNDNIKLDKINYNFDQLVANGGGPRGFQGTDGPQGYQGVTGYQGDQGSTGDQGDQGPSGESGQGIWKENGNTPGDPVKTILPIHDNAIYPNMPPTVAIGFKSSNSFYDTGIEQRASLVINRRNTLPNNLELKSEGSDNSAYFRVEEDAGTITLSTGFAGDATATKYNQYATLYSWKEESTGDNLLSLGVFGNDKKIIADVPAEFNEPVIVKQELKIENTTTPAGVDKIAVSEDADGTIDFKSIEDIGGVVPIGTIVSIDPSFYNSTNFIVEEQNVPSPANEPIQIKVGSGINTFAGWYLCHGQEWVNNIDPAYHAYISYQTEDLNSFTYTIDDNPNEIGSDSQGIAGETNNNVTVIGGADITMAANYSSPVYNISGNVGATTYPIQTGTSGTTFILKRLPQIIYLGEEDLFWHDKGTGQNTAYTNTYNITHTDAGAFASSVTYTPSSSMTSTAGFGDSVGQIGQITLTAPAGYLWTGSSANPAWTLPAGVSITSPVYSVGDSTNGWQKMQHTFSLNNQKQQSSQAITISFETDQAGSLTPVTTETNKYIINTKPNIVWSPDEETRTEQIGSTITLGTITGTSFQKYFDPSTAPIITNAYEGAFAVQRGPNLSGDPVDITVSSYQYKTMAGVVTTDVADKPTKVEIVIQDSDFANSSNNPSGTTADTTINIGGLTMYSYTPEANNGTAVWHGMNYNNWNSSETVTVTNDTSETLYFKLISSQVAGFNGNTSATVSVSGTHTGGSSNNLTVFTDSTHKQRVSNSYFIIAPGDSRVVTWSSVSVSGTNTYSGWETRLGYRSDTPTNSVYADWTFLS